MFYNYVSAQNQLYKYSFTGFIGAREYSGDLGNSFGTFKNHFANGGGIWSMYLNQNFDYFIATNAGKISYYKNSTNPRFASDMIDINMGIKFKVVNVSNCYNQFINPYFMIGVGSYYTFNNSAIKNILDINVLAGGGIKFRIGNKWGIDIRSTINYALLSDEYDGVSPIGNNNYKTTMNDAFLHHSIGLYYNFGKNTKNDKDKDGIVDNLDHCPNTPLSLRVDQHGCIFDKDEDGIADEIDRCPTVAGTLGLNGCPQPQKEDTLSAMNKCIDFDISKSFSETDGIGIYQWNFGDGTVLTGLIVKHCYTSKGNYLVTVDMVQPSNGFITLGIIKIKVEVLANSIEYKILE